MSKQPFLKSEAMQNTSAKAKADGWWHAMLPDILDVIHERRIEALHAAEDDCSTPKDKVVFVDKDDADLRSLSLVQRSWTGPVRRVLGRILFASNANPHKMGRALRSGIFGSWTLDACLTTSTAEPKHIGSLSHRDTWKHLSSLLESARTICLKCGDPPLGLVVKQLTGILPRCSQLETLRIYALTLHSSIPRLVRADAAFITALGKLPSFKNFVSRSYEPRRSVWQRDVAARTSHLPPFDANFAVGSMANILHILCSASVPANEADCRYSFEDGITFISLIKSSANGHFVIDDLRFMEHLVELDVRYGWNRPPSSNLPSCAETVRLCFVASATLFAALPPFRALRVLKADIWVRSLDFLADISAITDALPRSLELLVLVLVLDSYRNGLPAGITTDDVDEMLSIIPTAGCCPALRAFYLSMDGLKRTMDGDFDGVAHANRCEAVCLEHGVQFVNLSYEWTMPMISFRECDAMQYIEE